MKISVLPPGQRRAVLALMGGRKARTYRQAAQAANVSLGTLFTHLRRVRQRHPDLYEAIHAAHRLAQLERRHEEALERSEEHSYSYFKRKANYRYYQRFGHWPWERC